MFQLPSRQSKNILLMSQAIFYHASDQQLTEKKEKDNPLRWFINPQLLAIQLYLGPIIRRTGETH